MTRSATLLAGLAATALSTAALAQGPASPPDDTRYTFSKIDEGYLRLDGRTGQVSLCSRKTSGWACETVPDERTALEAEIARLQGANAALKKDMIARGLPLPHGAGPDISTAPRDDRKLLDQADIDRVMGFMEKVWRRLSDMLESLQKEAPGRT